MTGQYIEIVSDKNPILFDFTWRPDPLYHDLILCTKTATRKKLPVAFILKVAESLKN